MKSLLLLALSSIAVVSAQTATCVPSPNLAIVRSEGLTERVGDIIYSCTGLAGMQFTGNLTIALNTSVTNTLSMGNTLTGIVFTIDTGSGPQPVLVQPLLGAQNSIVYNGLSFAFSAQGGAILRIAGVRANANQLPAGSLITVNLAVTRNNLLFTTSQLNVATPLRGLYVGYSAQLVCAQNGSPLPDTINFANLITGNTSFSTTRVTEGFADAFGPKSAPAYFNAQNGQRIIVQYSGFPNDARLFVPDVVAGSDAVQPTAGGDLELPASGGAYVPSTDGSLLLARVAGAMSNGAGGSPVYAPGTLGSPTVAFNSVSEISVSGGTAYVVYEVVDANPAIPESAQFPTFLGLLPNGSRVASQTSETVFFAPQSNAGIATTSDPIPRFAAVTPPADCTILGDCSAILGHLSVNSTTLQLTSTAGGPTAQNYFVINNTGGGQMQWTATVSYTSGSGWLSLDTYSSVNTTTVRVYAAPGNLVPGTYQATITVSAPSAGGTATVPVTFVVTPASTPPSPTISDVLNGASLAAGPVVPGSITAIKGTAFSGKVVAATFDGVAAGILYASDTQLNVVVPDLGTKKSASLVVTSDGKNSPAQTVTVAPFQPAIFQGAILNQDLAANGANNPASVGTVVVLWATGLSGSGKITGHIADREITNPYYAGPAPSLIGVQQVNLGIPSDLPAMTTQLYVCGSAGGSPICSIPSQLYLK